MIRIPYGKEEKNLFIDDKRIKAILIPAKENKKQKEKKEKIIKRALAKPIESQRLGTKVKGASTLLIITSDHTRPVPSKVTLPILLNEIESNNSEIQIKILIATGCHRATTQKEMINKFGESLVNNYEFINHEATKMMQMVYKGQLPSGGELWVNELVNWADIIISEGFIEPHFFAGFSGGRKSILPGICAEQTVMANHCAEFIANENARMGVLENNPIHKDMVFAMEQVSLSFILNVVINEEKEIIYAVAGHPKFAHEVGCEFVKQQMAVKAVKADIVITSNGGYPLDQNIYQAVKGMASAAECVNEDGVIIMVAKCNDGHGGQAFYDYFAKAESAEQVVELIKDVPRNQTKPDQWQAQILANVLGKAHVIMVADESQKETIKAMKMGYTNSIEDALKQAEAQMGEEALVTVIPDGVGVIVEK